MRQRRAVCARLKVELTRQRRTLGYVLGGLRRCARRIIVKRDRQRVVRRCAAVRIRDHVAQHHRRICRALVIRAGRMQHVVQQRHRVGTRCLVRDLHLEQVCAHTRRIRARRDLGRQHATHNRVRHRLLAQRRRSATERRGKREAIAACSISSHAALQHAREHRFARVRVAGQVRIQVAHRARRVATRQTVIVHRCHRLVVIRRRVRIRHLEREPGLRRVPIPIRHRERAHHRGHRRQRHRIGLELVAAVRLRTQLACPQVHPL